MSKTETINFHDFMNQEHVSKNLKFGSITLMSSIGVIPYGSFFSMPPMVVAAYGIILTAGLGAIVVSFLDDSIAEVFETLLKMVGTAAAFGFLIWLMSGGII